MGHPDFLIIGAAKCGTTSVCAYCAQHPEIFVSPLKEARFLAYDGKVPNYRGYGSQGGRIMDHYDKTLPTSWEKYQALFDEARPGQKTGEASPAYLYLDKAADTIRKYVPESRLIVILRNPIERAYSSYLHLLRDNAESLPFERALDAESRRISENAGLLWRYVDLGYYGRQIQHYKSIFPGDQLMVILHEELLGDQERCMSRIFDFIGVDPTFEPDTRARLNVSGIPRNRALYEAINRQSILHGLGRMIPAPMRSSLKYRFRSILLKKPGLDPKLRQRLIITYQEDIRLLQDLIGRDLSHWLA